MNAPETEADEAADFLARLSDLDTFIGTATGPVPTAIPHRPVALPPLPSVAGPRLTRRLFDADEHRDDVAASDPADAEAAEFLERLGQLDDFIGSGGPEPVQAPTPAVPDAEDEADEFLQRLGDLDRFIGGSPNA